MRSSRSRSHSLVRLPEAEGLGDVDGVEVVLLVSSPAEVSLGDSLGKRPINEAEGKNTGISFSLRLQRISGGC